jgi:hypothetical protein
VLLMEGDRKNFGTVIQLGSPKTPRAQLRPSLNDKEIFGSLTSALQQTKKREEGEENTGWYQSAHRTCSAVSRYIGGWCWICTYCILDAMSQLAGPG